MVRFTIRRLMIAVAIVAGCLAYFRMFGLSGGTGLLIFLLIFFGSGYLAFLMPRLTPEHPELTSGGVILVSALFCIPIAQNEVYTVGAAWFEMSHIFLLLASPMLLGWTLGWTVGQIKRGPTRRFYVEQTLIVFMLIFPWSMVWTHWPLYLAFAWSEPALNQLADRVEAGEAVSYPVKSGVYSIAESKKIQINGFDGQLFKIDYPGDRTGFARSLTNKRVDKHFLGKGYDPFNYTGAWWFAPDAYAD